MGRLKKKSVIVGDLRSSVTICQESEFECGYIAIKILLKCVYA